MFFQWGGYNSREVNGRAHTVSRLLGPPSDFTLSQFFASGKEDSIYGKLYKNNMNGMESFLMIEDALQNLVNSSKTAIIFNGDRIRFYEDYHCKVNLFGLFVF